MTKNEIESVIYQLQTYRPSLKSLEKQQLEIMLSDYRKVLAEYDYEDVSKRLSQLLSSEKEYNINPYLLVSGLVKSEFKARHTELKGKIYCPDCGEYLTILNMVEHKARHNSIKYLRRSYKKYLNKELSKTDEELMAMDEKLFKTGYYKALEEFSKVATGIEYKGIMNVLATRNGGKAPYSINEVC